MGLLLPAQQQRTKIPTVQLLPLTTVAGKRAVVKIHPRHHPLPPPPPIMSTPSTTVATTKPLSQPSLADHGLTADSPAFPTLKVPPKKPVKQAHCHLSRSQSNSTPTSLQTMLQVKPFVSVTQTTYLLVRNRPIQSRMTSSRASPVSSGLATRTTRRSSVPPGMINSSEKQAKTTSTGSKETIISSAVAVRTASSVLQETM